MIPALRQRLRPFRRWTSPVNALLIPRATARPPIIVVGMHRSGTAMVARLLERSGVFMGQPQSANQEAIFFQQLNRRTLDSVGVGWRCLDYLPDVSTLGEHYGWLDEWLHRKLEFGLVTKYWGRYSARLLRQTDPLWGWKDPRNTLLLPVWGRFFPNATVIHIYRDGRDVAISLLTREVGNVGTDIFSRAEAERRLRLDMALWAEYYRRAEAGAALFPLRHTLHFEALLADPQGEWTRLCEAIRLTPACPLHEVVSIIDPTRTARFQSGPYAWVADVDFATPLLAELGYT